MLVNYSSMNSILVLIFSIVFASVTGIYGQLFGASMHSPMGLFATDSFGADSGYSSSDVFLNPMELAQIMDAQRAEDMRGYTSGYGGMGGGRAPSFGGGPSYDGPPEPAEPQAPDGPPAGYSDGDQSEGPPSDGPTEGGNYNGGGGGGGPEEEYSGPQQGGGRPGGYGGGESQGGPGGYGGGRQQGGPDGYGGGPGDNDGGYSNEGDAYKTDGDSYGGQQGGPPQGQYDQNEDGPGNGYNNGPPQHSGNGYGQDTPSENYNGKYRQLLVERPQGGPPGGPQGYDNENDNGYHSNGPHGYDTEQRHPTYESSGYEDDKAVKPHALPQAQFIHPSSGYSQQEDYESNNQAPNERPESNGGFRPMHPNAQAGNGGYKGGMSKQYYNRRARA